MTKNWDANEAYARSKLCIVMSTWLLGKKLGKDAKGKVVSVHPGIVRTDIISEIFSFGLKGQIIRVFWLIFYPLYSFMTKNTFEGNRTTMYCLL